MELPDAADFRANPAAEAQSRAQTARLYNMSDDPGVRDMLKFNLVRDTLHQNLWLKAMGSVPAPDPKLYATYDGSMGQPSGPAMGTKVGLAGKTKDKLS